jgi:hypothetical protein
MRKDGFMNVLNKNISILNNSKLFAGIVMILLNIGSKHITLNFSKNQEGYIKNALGRQMLIFAMSWIGSRDVYISIMLTAAFTILADHILNEDSKHCILPKKWKNLYNTIDLNNDGEITEDEIEYAINVLNEAKKKGIDNQRQMAFNSFYKESLI